MTRPGPSLAATLPASVAAFAQAASPDALWRDLHQQLAGFGIDAIQYGCTPLGMPWISQTPLLLDSFDPAFLALKQSENLLDTDTFFSAGLGGTRPILWSDSDPIALCKSSLSPLARRSLDIDWAFGYTTGVTLPIRFPGTACTGVIGLNAGGLSWDDFDRIWAERHLTLIALTNAFCAALHRDHLDTLFPLTPAERDCLCWLAAGLAPKQIAHRLGLTDKQLGYRLATARRKLKAATTPQAVATALVFGLIAP